MESLSRISRCGRVDRWIQEALHGNQTLHPFVSCLFGNFRSKHARSGQQCLKSNLVETQSGLFFAPFLLTTCAEDPPLCKFLTLHALRTCPFALGLNRLQHSLVFPLMNGWARPIKAPGSRYCRNLKPVTNWPGGSSVVDRLRATSIITCRNSCELLLQGVKSFSCQACVSLENRLVHLNVRYPRCSADETEGYSLPEVPSCN